MWGRGERMKVRLYRYSREKMSTLGILKIEGKLVSYTLENTRYLIPKGKYEIKYRKVGGFHNRYEKKFKDMHKGMLELQNIKGRKWILIHCGNTASDSKGCILLGSKANINTQKKGFIEESTMNYEEVYPLIRDKLEIGDKVEIIIENI